MEFIYRIALFSLDKLIVNIQLNICFFLYLLILPDRNCQIKLFPFLFSMKELFWNCTNHQS